MPRCWCSSIRHSFHDWGDLVNVAFVFYSLLALLIVPTTGTIGTTRGGWPARYRFSDNRKCQLIESQISYCRNVSKLATREPWLHPRGVATEPRPLTKAPVAKVGFICRLVSHLQIIAPPTRDASLQGCVCFRWRLSKSCSPPPSGNAAFPFSAPFARDVITLCCHAGGRCRNDQDESCVVVVFRTWKIREALFGRVPGEQLRSGLLAAAWGLCGMVPASASSARHDPW